MHLANERPGRATPYRGVAGYTRRTGAFAALVLCLATAGCMHLPPEVEAELSPPDGKRPNNYAAQDRNGQVDTPAAGSLHR